MNIWESYMTCIDENNKCRFNEPVPFNIYDEYAKTIPKNDDKKQEKLNKFICNDKLGIPMQCCNSKSANANEIITDTNYKLIKPIYDASGNIIQYQVCKCTTEKCKSMFCSDFKQPTRYEACKARSVDEKNTVKLNSFTDVILQEHSYPDCYEPCQ